MKEKRITESDPRVRSAISGLKKLILSRYPDTTFAVFHGEDPEGTYLRATVDIEDLDEVMDLVTDLLLDIEVEQGLPVYIALTQPDERIAAPRRDPYDPVANAAALLDALSEPVVRS